MNINTIPLGEQTLVIFDKNGNIISLNKKILEKVFKSDEKTKFILITDEYNNINIISCDTNAKKILKNENELEILNLKLKDIKTNLRDLRSNSWSAEFINFFTYALDIFLFLLINSLLGFPIAFSIVSFYHITMKIFNIACFGSRISRLKKIKNEKIILEDLKNQINFLEIDINKLKLNSNYNRINFEEMMDKFNSINNSLNQKNIVEKIDSSNSYKINNKVYKIGQKSK